MNTNGWLSLLVDQVPFSPELTGALDRQLRDHARMSAGVELDDGYHVLVPPTGKFEVQFKVLGQGPAASMVGYIEAELVGSDAKAHPVVLAWRSRSRPGQRIAPDMTLDQAGEVEFFWIQFPVADLRSGERADEATWNMAIQPSFAMEWDIPRWPGIWIQIKAAKTFSREQVAEIASVMDAVIAGWNGSHESKIHYRGEPELSGSLDRMDVYIDFGSADQDALVQVIRALDQRSTASAIAICRAGSGRRG